MHIFKTRRSVVLSFLLLVGGGAGWAVSSADTPKLPAEASAEWWGHAQRDIEAREYEISWQEGGEAVGFGSSWQAPNRAQNLRTYFTPAGPRAVRRAAVRQEWTWGMELVCVNGKAAPALETTRAEGNRFEYVRAGGITEWYVNDAKGLEQGFTLAERPDGDGLVVLEVATHGNLLGGMMPDGETAEFLTVDGVGIIHFGGLKAWDAAGTELAGRMEMDGKARIRMTVDAKNAVYPLTIDPVATSASWTGESDQDTANYGFSVATAGDVNGDGFSDVIVGAPLYDGAQLDGGAAYVYLGSSSGLSASASWNVQGDKNGAQYGGSVATVGDVNGDGYSDIVVGAHTYDVDGDVIGEGAAFVYYGGATGPGVTANWTGGGGMDNEAYGRSVATAGDVNGDGFSDVVVGATGYANGQAAEGRAYVYLGSSTGLSGTAAWTWESNSAGALFGSTVGTAGDVNGDGFGDLLVAAYMYSNGELNEGAVFVFHGGASGLPAGGPSWTLEGNYIGAQMGYSTGTAGDVNGDGYADVIASAPQYNLGFAGEGLVVAYYGSATGLAATPNFRIRGNAAGVALGSSVGTVGDVNGDGYADVAVGVTSFTNGQTNEGAVMGWFGSATGLYSAATQPTPDIPTNRDWVLELNQADAAFGCSVATAGDVNGDGYADVIAGAINYDNGQTNEGRAAVFLGSAAIPTAAAANTTYWRLDPTNEANANYGFSVSSAGDVNGDGFGDVIVGAPYFDSSPVITDQGGAFLYFGSATGLPSSVSWSRLGGLASAKFGYSVSSIGDVNGDGYGDIAVGAPGYSNGQAGEGRVYVYNGSATGPGGASRVLEVDSAGAAFGTSVAWAGDVNGDGYADMMVGAPSFTNDDTNEGRVYVYHGGPSGIVGVEAWRREGNAVGALLGGSVAGAGDVNRDGYDDIIVGAAGITGGGAAYVYYGSGSGLALTPAWTGGCGQAGANYGVSVAGAGDINGDGYSDVLVGANLYDNTLADEGRAYAYYGSATGPGASPWVSNGGIAGAYYGFSVAGAGDLNHDGYSEVLVGAPMATITQTNEGRILAFRGSSAGVGAIVINVRPAAASLQYGFSVCGCGDVNGDGYGEVMYGVPQFSTAAPAKEGRALVYYGNCEMNNSVGLALKPRQTKTDGSLLAPEGKSDRIDAARVVMLGKSPFGRAKVAMEVEAKPLGVAFNGAGLQRSASWTDTLVAGTDIEKILSGLTKSSVYHWRARLVYHPATVPFQVRSRWLTPAWNAETENDFRTATPPADPTNPGVGAATTSSITWTWNDNATDETGYGIWVDPGTADPTAQRALAAANATSYVYGGLSVNSQYAFQVNAKSTVGDSGKTATITGWTLAAVAAQPVVSAPTTISLDVQLGAAGSNPAYTVYAVQVSPAVGGNSWVQADGSVGAAAVYQTLSAWATTTVKGLSDYTLYSFTVVARNGGGVNSAASAPGTGRTLDGTAPSGSIQINSGAAYTTSPAVTLALTYNDGVGSGVAEMRFSEDNSNWSAWEAVGLTSAFALTGADGVKPVFVQFRDVAGNVSVGDISASIVLETSIPTGTISINGGTSCTNNATVALDLTADDGGGSGVVEMQFSEDGVNWSGWEPVAATRSFLLSGTDGAKAVYVQYRDAAGNVSVPQSAGISLDTAGPAVSVVVDGGALFTGTTSVTLGITADDGTGCGVTTMRFSEDGLNWSPWEPVAALKGYVFQAGDGLKSVYAEVQDAAGNLSAVPAMDTITLDTTGPAATVLIDGGNAYTAANTLSLALTEDDGLGSGTSEMRFSEDGIGWSDWEAYSASKSYTVAVGDGVKTVRVELRDALGNVSAVPAQDDIVLDTSAPVGTLTIDGGASYATTVNVTLALTSDDGTGSGVADMRVSEDGSNWGAWESYSATKPFALSGPDGSKTVYVELRDAAGNTTVPALQDSIVLDVNAPTGAVLIEGGAAYATTAVIALALTANDGTGSGVAEMRFSEDGVNWDGWQAYASTASYLLSGGDGAKTVYAEFKDAAGNASAAPVQDDVILDTQKPTGTLVIDGGATYAYITAVNLAVTGDDASGSGVTDMRFGDDGVNWGPWEPFAATKAYALSGSDGPKTVFMELRDAAGNVSVPAVTASIALDTQSPTGSVQINLGTGYTNAPGVVLSLSASDMGSGVTDMRFSEDGINWGGWEPYSDSAPFVLTGGDGVKTVYAEFMDAAGRSSSAVSDTITLDRVAPTATVTRVDSSPTTAVVLHFAVAFDEPVTPVFGAGQILVTGGLSAIPAVTGSGPYTVTVVVTAPKPDGAVGIDLASGITDLAGNALAVVPAPSYDLVYWPGFAAEPQSARKYVAETQTYGVSVNAGSRTPAYQWKFSSGTVQNGPTAAAWPLGALTLAKAGTYWCEVTYGGLVFASNHANLEVRNRISITQPPVGANIIAGTSYQFTVGAAGGYGPLSYQWKKDGANIDGAEGDTYTVSQSEISDSGVYTVEVRDTNGDAVESAQATLTVEKGTPLSGVLGFGALALMLAGFGVRRVRNRAA